MSPYLGEQLLTTLIVKSIKYKSQRFTVIYARVAQASRIARANVFVI